MNRYEQDAKVFPRSELKYEGKRALQGHWGPAIVITLLLALFATGGQYAIIKIIYPSISVVKFLTGTYYIQDMMTHHADFSASLQGPRAALLIITIIVVGILVQGVFTLAASMWYVNLRQGSFRTKLGHFFENFSYGIKGVLLYLWISLWYLIWGALFFAPFVLLSFLVGEMVLFVGLIPLLIVLIIKSAQYALCFYALADNPEIGAREALRMSIEATRGHVGDIILTWLSFIGWFILYSIIPPVQLYVIPYLNSTFAGIWLHLRDESLREHRIKPEMFNLVAVDDEGNLLPAKDDAIPTAPLEERKDQDDE